MSPTDDCGFFTDEELTKMNFKTSKDQLLPGFDGDVLLSLLAVKTKELIPDSDLDTARKSVVQWYLDTPSEDVCDEISRYELKSEEYRQHREVIKMMHSMSNDDWLDFERFIASTKA
jgi:hypothetical protein